MLAASRVHVVQRRVDVALRVGGDRGRGSIGPHVVQESRVQVGEGLGMRAGAHFRLWPLAKGLQVGALLILLSYLVWGILIWSPPSKPPLPKCPAPTVWEMNAEPAFECSP
jgi:hypothetical protein